MNSSDSEDGLARAPPSYTPPIPSAWRRVSGRGWGGATPAPRDEEAAHDAEEDAPKSRFVCLCCSCFTNTRKEDDAAAVARRKLKGKGKASADRDANDLEALVPMRSLPSKPRSYRTRTVKAVRETRRGGRTSTRRTSRERDGGGGRFAPVASTSRH